MGLDRVPEGLPGLEKPKQQFVSILVQANKKSVAPLPNFLNTTEIRGREGATEQEAQWGRRNDQLGEDLLR